MKNLHIDSIRKCYNDKVILSDIFMSCRQGEIVGLIGRNGSGKSTLMKIIFGCERAENKFVAVDNKMLKGIRDSKNLINYLPQESFLPGNFKVQKLIRLFLSEEHQVRLFGNEFISSKLHYKFRNLSSGEKRICEVLLLLHSQAYFLLLDEPFLGVSPVVKEMILDLISKEKDKKGFIISDHDYKNILKIADRVLYLENGTLTEITNEKDLFKRGYIPATLL